MSGRWWRAYGRARHDPKLLKLSDKDFRWWFNLVCAASDNGGVLPPCDDLAVEFRVSRAAMSKTLDAMVASGLFDHDETGIHPHNWNALQFVSDRSSDRVKQFRERRRNVSVTPSENRDREQSNSEAKASGADAPQFDPVKAMFDDGVRLLTGTGTNEKQARSLVGKWRRDHGDEATREAIQAAYDCGITQPCEWIPKRLGIAGRPHETWDQRRIREAMEAIQ